MPRQFTDSPAKRAQVPLLVGLAGPSGGGKTYSALRLATGICKVTGGDIFAIDTESNRMLHYADRFKFRHVPFGAPFNPGSYLEAIEYCVSKGAKVIVIDSMSHEHEGPGGLLEMHAAEVDRMSKGDAGKAERVKMLAWAKPKQERRRLLNTMLQIPCNFVFCFRAKEKVDMKNKDANGQPRNLGFMPIAGDEFVYEMTTQALLLPGAGGVPTWNPQEVGEKLMVKLPEQFRKLLLNHQGPITEELGEKMAAWSVGDVPIEDLESELRGVTSLEELAEVWYRIPPNYRNKMKGLKDEMKAKLEAPNAEGN